jgi:hypothetical protein
MAAAAEKIVEAFKALDAVEQQRVLGRLLEIADDLTDDDDTLEDDVTAAAAATFAMLDAEEEAAERAAPNSE